MQQKKERIPLIDDDNRNIFALSAVLRSKGFDVVTAVSAVDGIKIMQEQGDFLVVLLDMMMPDMDGYQALGIIKSDAELKQVPVVAVTAQAMMGDRERCLQAGADDYISKPVDVDLLLNLLHSYKAKKQHER